MVTALNIPINVEERAVPNTKYLSVIANIWYGILEACLFSPHDRVEATASHTLTESGSLLGFLDPSRLSTGKMRGPD